MAHVLSVSCAASLATDLDLRAKLSYRLRESFRMSYVMNPHSLVTPTIYSEGLCTVQDI